MLYYMGKGGERIALSIIYDIMWFRSKLILRQMVYGYKVFNAPNSYLIMHYLENTAPFVRQSTSQPSDTTNSLKKSVFHTQKNDHENT